MEYRVLGPFEVLEDGRRRLELGGPRQRALLTLLLFHANEVVSVDRLMEELWAAGPPGSVANSLQQMVST